MDGARGSPGTLPLRGHTWRRGLMKLDVGCKRCTEEAAVLRAGQRALAQVTMFLVMWMEAAEWGSDEQAGRAA